MSVVTSRALDENTKAHGQMLWLESFTHTHKHTQPSYINTPFSFLTYQQIIEQGMKAGKLPENMLLPGFHQLLLSEHCGKWMRHASRRKKRKKNPPLGTFFHPDSGMCCRPGVASPRPSPFFMHLQINTHSCKVTNDASHLALFPSTSVTRQWTGTLSTHHYDLSWCFTDWVCVWLSMDSIS